MNSPILALLSYSPGCLARCAMKSFSFLERLSNRISGDSASQKGGLAMNCSCFLHFLSLGVFLSQTDFQVHSWSCVAAGGRRQWCTGWGEVPLRLIRVRVLRQGDFTCIKSKCPVSTRKSFDDFAPTRKPRYKRLCAC